MRWAKELMVVLILSIALITPVVTAGFRGPLNFAEVCPGGDRIIGVPRKPQLPLPTHIRERFEKFILNRPGSDRLQAQREFEQIIESATRAHNLIQVCVPFGESPPKYIWIPIA